MASSIFKFSTSSQTFNCGRHMGFMEITATKAAVFALGLLAGFWVGRLAGEDWAEERTFKFLTGRLKI